MPKLYGSTEIIGDMLITGSFSILGSASTINTTNLLVSDPILVLAHGQTGSPILDSGFFVDRGASATVGFIWDESVDQFALIQTSDNHESIGNVNISSYSDLRLGNIGIGGAIPANTNAYIKGIGSTSSTYALKIESASASSLFNVRNDGLVSIGGLTGSGTRILTVDSTGNLIAGSASSSTGTIKGTIPTQQIASSLNKHIPFGSGVLDTITTDNDFYYAPSTKSLFIGNLYTIVFPYYVGELNLSKTGNGATNFINQANSGTGSTLTAIWQSESSTKWTYIGRYNSTYVGTYFGTSLSLNNGLQLSASVDGNDGTAPIVLSGTASFSLIGSSAGNSAKRHDSVGLRVGLMSDIHTTNRNGLTIQTNSYFGGNATASARVHVIGSDNTSSNFGFKVDSASSSSLFSIRNDGNVGVGTASPSTRLSVKSSGTQSSNAYLITNADNINLLYGNESGTYFNASNGGLISNKSNVSYGLNGTFIGNDANTNYAALDIGIWGIGAYISLSHNNNNTTIWTSTTIGGSSRGLVGNSARVAVADDGSFGVRNIGFAYNGNNGSTIYAIGNESDGLDTTIRLHSAPSQFGITSSTSLNNGWRVGIGTASVSTHRVVISEGLKIIGTSSGKAIQIIDGTESAGKVLTSDVNGVATWQPGSSLCEFYSDGSSLGTTLTVLYTTSGLIDTSNLLAKNGDKVKGVFSGYFTGATASTKSVHLYFGGNDLFGSSALAYNSPSYWRVEFCIIRSNSSQIRQDITFSIYDSVTKLSHIEQSSGAYASFDFTTDEVIEILGQSVGGGSADGDIISRAGYIEYTPSK